MPIYRPIDIGRRLAASRSDLIDFQWTIAGLVAVFEVPDAGRLAVRVNFDRQCIARLLDEMALSTEEDGEASGLVPDHFAYEVEDSAFARQQSATWQQMFGPVRHYRFVTGWTCLDVLSGAEPAFSLVEFD